MQRPCSASLIAFDVDGSELNLFGGITRGFDSRRRVIPPRSSNDSGLLPHHLCSATEVDDGRRRYGRYETRSD